MIFVSFPSGSQPGGGTLLAHCFPDAKTPQTAQKVNGWGPFFANDSQGYIAYGTGNFDGQVRVCVCVRARARARVCVCVCVCVRACWSKPEWRVRVFLQIMCSDRAWLCTL